VRHLSHLGLFLSSQSAHRAIQLGEAALLCCQFHRASLSPRMYLSGALWKTLLLELADYSSSAVPRNWVVPFRDSSNYACNCREMLFKASRVSSGETHGSRDASLISAYRKPSCPGYPSRSSSPAFVVLPCASRPLGLGNPESDSTPRRGIGTPPWPLLSLKELGRRMMSK
jgi:hypothetical protein